MFEHPYAHLSEPCESRKPGVVRNVFLPEGINLCLPLALLYNKQQLAGTSSLELDEIRFRGAMLQRQVGCVGEMIPPAQQLKLLERTGTSCALMDRGAGLLVILGLTRSTIKDISLCLLESPNHVRSYFEATGQQGRTTLGFDELCTFAEAEGLQLIHHREGSRYWQSRPLGGDSVTPTAKSAEADLKTPSPPGLGFMRPSSRSGFGSEPPSTVRPVAVGWTAEETWSPIRGLASAPEVDARLEWLVRLAKDVPLQNSVGKGLFYQLRLDAKGLTPREAQAMFITTVCAPKAAGIRSEMTGQGATMAAGMTSALALLLAERLFHCMASQLALRHVISPMTFRGNSQTDERSWPGSVPEAG